MGRLIAYGSAQYASPGSRPNYLKLLYYYLQRPKLDVQNMINLNKSVMPFNLIHIYQEVAIMHQLLGEMAQLDLGKPFVGHQFEFEHLHDAIRLFQSGKTMGKVVVTISD